MSRSISLTASTLRAMLQYIDPEGGPKIAADNDSLAEPLVEKIREAVGERHGSARVIVTFGDDEVALQAQFTKVAENISGLFGDVASISRELMSG